MYEYPPILTGSALQQIAALRDYLVRCARENDGEGLAPSAVGRTPMSAGGASLAPATTAARAGDGPDAALRALIVKTADLTERHLDELRSLLREDYLARSDFGEYRELIETQIRQTARETVESYGYEARLSAAEGDLAALEGSVTNLNGQIRRGLITDPETQETALGIAISQSLRFTGNSQTAGGLTYYELAPGQTLGLYTSTGWQFWCNGSKRGWFDSSDGMLHVRQILVEGDLRHGADWLVTTAGGYGLRYIGT